MEWRKLFRKTYVVLAIIFLVALAARLYFSFQTQDFEPDAYFTLRQVSHISQTGFPLYKDDLSYQGRTYLFAPLYYYVLAFFNLFMPLTLVAKIIPNILASLIIFIIYLICLRITKNINIALTAAFLSGFIPIFFITANSVSVYSLVIPLIFFIIYCFFRISETKYLEYSLIAISLLVLTHPTAFLLVIGLLLYLLLLKAEGFEIEKRELELILFLTFLVFWANLLIYKKAFLMHGANVIWQNIPQQILLNFFSQIGFLESFYSIGIIPLILGIYAIYIVLFQQKNKYLFTLIGFALSVFILMWFKFIQIGTGLIFLSISLVIFSAYALKNLSILLQKTKFSKYYKWFAVVFIILFIVTSIIPSFIAANERNKQTLSKDEIKALTWIKENTPENSTVAATLDEGYIVEYFAERKTLMDNNFLLIEDVDQRAKDLDTIYKVRFKTDTINIMNYYNAQYIYLSPRTQSQYKIQNLVYAENDTCFDAVYDDVIKIYKSKCVLE